MSKPSQATLIHYPTSPFHRVLNAMRWSLYFLNTFWFFAVIPIFLRFSLAMSFQKVWGLARFWAYLSLKIFGIKINLIKKNSTKIKPDGQYIFISNHRSFLDHFLMQVSFKNPTHYVAKKEFANYKLLDMGGKAYEFIPADKNKLSAENKEKMKAYILRKESLAIFIEGTRNSKKNLLPFNRGAFRLSAKYNIPIVPLFIYGTHDKMSKHDHLLNIKTGTATLIVDEPIQFEAANLEHQISEFEIEYRKKHSENMIKYENI